MDTNKIRTATAAVTGARHARTGRNGQDAVASWISADAAAVVVCDGCSSGASSEVGARLGASLVIHALATRITAGACAADPALWAAVRAEVVAVVAGLLERMPAARALEDHFLFTIVAAAIDREHAVVWAIGDGMVRIDGRTRELGPFADNQPPYLAYDLVGSPAEATFEVAPAGTVIVATDGAVELELARFGDARFVDHPDALRRELAVLARTDDNIDWDTRRVVRTAAALQDDCAIGVLRWEPS
jgi:serine/threonine protein phosphatase PrpC